MYIFYQIGIYLYYLLILLVSPFNSKAKLWINGRNAQRNQLKQSLAPAKRIWFHFASLGEFEQGRVLLENIHSLYPEYKFIITFFSPSGYEIRKNYALAEKVYYLPLDTRTNAKILLDHIKPSLIFFNKYEYWHHYISESKKRNIPLFITSSVFRNDQLFFKAYGSFQRSILKAVRHFFLQNEYSLELLKTININNATVAGDTRFDRVYEHSMQVKADDLIDKFCLNAKVFVAGSTWPEDEQILQNLLLDFPEMKFIIVPHEISNGHIKNLQKLYGDEAILYTDTIVSKNTINQRVLIVNTIGLLNSIYKKAHYCYIGGGFGAGIHNTLEAAAFGKVLFFGPNYKKFNEATELIKIGAAFSIHAYADLHLQIVKLENDNDIYNNSGQSAKQFVLQKKGASAKIINYLEQEKYLN